MSITKHVEGTDWHAEVKTCSPAHCCRHQALAPRSAEYILATSMHMLRPTSCRQGSMLSLLTESWQVMTEPTYWISASSSEGMLAKMQACLKQLCGIAACGHPDMIARLIAEKFAASNQAQPEVLNGEEGLVNEAVALPASITAAAADQSQLSSELYIYISCQLSSLN